MSFKDGKDYLRSTQPDVWKVAYEMSCLLSADLADKNWREKVFLVDAFIRELIEEINGPDGLNEMADLPIAEAVGEDDPRADEAGQIVASIRAVITAALLDLPEEEKKKLEDVDDADQALVLFLSELDKHNEAARGWTAVKTTDAVLETLKSLAAITVLMLADLASSHSIEALTSSEKLRQALRETWGGGLTVH